MWPTERDGPSLFLAEGCLSSRILGFELVRPKPAPSRHPGRSVCYQKRRPRAGPSRLVICVAVSRHRRLAGILTASLAAASLPSVADAHSENARVCAGCHREVWETYRRTGMGRSFFRPSPESAVEDFTNQNTFYHQPSDSYLTMMSRDGKFYQRRYHIDSPCKPINAIEKHIDYIMGSGNHSRAYLHRTAGNAIVELPL